MRPYVTVVSVFQRCDRIVHYTPTPPHTPKQQLKQLWRFIEKREEALAVRQEEARALGFTLDSSSGGGGSGAPAGGRPILGFLYRYTVGTLVGTGAAIPGADGDGGNPSPPPSLGAAGASGQPSGGTSSYLAHLPTGGSTATAAGSGGGEGGHTGTWTSSIAAEAEIQAEEIGTPGGGATAAEGGGGLLAGFDLLRHARSGGEVLTLFCSMCLATLRLREMVDALLLLGGQDPSRAPYPSLQPWAARAGAAAGAAAGGNASAKSGKWQQHAAASAQWPWARFGETAGEVVLDTFLAIREQFPTASSSSSFSSSGTSAVAAAAAAAVQGPGARRGKGGECSAEERLAVLGRVCVELRDFECLLALGTFLRDARTVAAALKRGKLWPREYRALFLDERMEAGGPAVKAFVDRCTSVTAPATGAAAAEAADATGALAGEGEGEVAAT